MQVSHLHGGKRILGDVKRADLELCGGKLISWRLCPASLLKGRREEEYDGETATLQDWWA